MAKFRTGTGGGSSVRIKQTAAAGPDDATKGQVWVKNTSPQNELYFTTGDGNDIQLTTGTTAAGGGGGSTADDLNSILHSSIFGR